MTKKKQIMKVLEDFPNLTNSQIAKRVGCHPSYVNLIENEWRSNKFLNKTQAEMFEGVEQVSVQDMNIIDAVLDERGSRYGKFTTHAEITQTLKREATRYLVRQCKELDFDQQEALDMIFHKIGRIINGDPNYADSWVDIAGYAKLVADRLEGKVR